MHAQPWNERRRSLQGRARRAGSGALGAGRLCSVRPRLTRVRVSAAARISSGQKLGMAGRPPPCFYLEKELPHGHKLFNARRRRSGLQSSFAPAAVRRPRLPQLRLGMHAAGPLVPHPPPGPPPTGRCAPALASCERWACRCTCCVSMLAPSCRPIASEPGRCGCAWCLDGVSRCRAPCLRAAMSGATAGQAQCSCQLWQRHVCVSRPA